MTLPPVPELFYWTELPCGTVLKCRALDAVAPHLFTTRELPLRSRDDWRHVGSAIGADHVATLEQVHGRDVVTIRRGSLPPAVRRKADVLISDNPGVAVAVRAADCVPLLLADSKSGAVGAVHAGWRGTAAGAAAAAVEALTREFGVRPQDLVAAIGPSIGACCYEVGSDVVDAFAAEGHPRHLVDRWFGTPSSSDPSRFGFEPRTRTRNLEPGTRNLDPARPRFHLDVAAANRDQLVLAGVPASQIHACGLCTAMHLGVLTSYRAEKEKAGRMAAVVRCRS